jgi:hypothetical protein
MDFPEGYEIGLNEEIKLGYYPNLMEGKNFEFTSLRTDMPEFYSDGESYNCVAWALGEIEWLEMSRFIKKFNLKPPYNESAYGYAKVFEEYYGFEFCDNGEFEAGYEKIVLYEKEGSFQHIALLKENGKWTTKFGDFEDVEHNAIEDIAYEGYGGYGTPKIYMKRLLHPKVIDPIAF